LINVASTGLGKACKSLCCAMNTDKPKYKFNRRHHHSRYIELCQA
ncbi:hypothetical protein T11_4417, partial [Trichinella zimbabwensis]